ncbi:MAG TPA: head GIN domain-containing protein [Steroidobacteraceae bacterium]|nr:head GIN domain-containing protein [Steroidobacteraceae bacterium]
MSVKFTRAALLIALCALSACKGREEAVEQSETRSLKAFDAIDLKGGAELALEVGRTQSVKVRATHDTLSHLRTEVRDGTLIVRRDSDDWSFGRSRGLNLTISVPKLTSVKLEGGNHVVVNGLDGGDIAFEVRGATSIEASGKVESLRIHMQGAGEANFSKLIAENVDVTVEGVGKVSVNAQQKLAATMNGLGAIRYAGHPADVSTRLNGFGSISQTDEENASPPAAKEPPPNPADLQPEYDEKKTSDENSTEVI